MRLFVSTFALSLIACAANSGDESFIIRSDLAPTTGSTTCQFTPSLEAASIARGQITLDSPNAYIFFPLLESRIVAPTGKESLRTIFVKGANVDLQVGPIEKIDTATGQVDVDDTVETTGFQTLFATPIPPNGGLAAGEFDLVPVSVLAGIKQRVGAVDATIHVHAQITATATVFGDYYGDKIESSPFEFPVTACNDCVVVNQGSDGTFPLCADFTDTTHTGNSCNPFQDGLVACCDAGNGVIACPGMPAGMGG
jgi:hypothetical protein